MTTKLDAILQAIDKLNRDFKTLEQQAHAIKASSNGLFLGRTVKNLDNFGDELAYDTAEAQKTASLLDQIRD